MKEKRAISIWMVALTIVMLTIAIVAVILVVWHNKNEKREHLQECYNRQNRAFLLTEDGEYEGYIDGATEYRPFDKCSRISQLYMDVLCYNYETDSQLSLDDIEDYLSKEFETDGTPRLYTDYKEIKQYVDFYNTCKERMCNPLDYFEIRVVNELEKIPGNKELSTYEIYQNSPLDMIEKAATKVYEDHKVMQ